MASGAVMAKPAGARLYSVTGQGRQAEANAASSTWAFRQNQMAIHKQINSGSA
jgi:hypothetical protein